MNAWSNTLGWLMGTGLGLAGVAQATPLDEMTKALFADNKSISLQMQQQIAQDLQNKGFMLSQGQIATEKCGVVPVNTEIKDLNADGQSEVLMLIGNACTSGVIGSTLYLFTQEADQRVQRHFGFSASGYELLPTKNDAWPAFLVKGTGNCQPVWKYKSGRYGFSNLYESEKGGCYVPQSDKFGG
jgi:hypothetical protein